MLPLSGLIWSTWSQKGVPLLSVLSRAGVVCHRSFLSVSKTPSAIALGPD